MSEFTKGPWRIEYSRSALFLTAVDADRNCFANCMQEHRTLYGPDPDASEFIADIAVKCDNEGHANLNLIASAPDMYEALKRLVDYIEIEIEDHTVGGTMTHGLDCAVIHAKEIVAKAKGETK